jgi:hypothetical protein
MWGVVVYRYVGVIPNCGWASRKCDDRRKNMLHGIGSQKLGPSPAQRSNTDDRGPRFRWSPDRPPHLRPEAPHRPAKLVPNAAPEAGRPAAAPLAHASHGRASAVRDCRVDDEATLAVLIAAEKRSTCLGGDESPDQRIVDALENLEHLRVESVLRETEDGSDRLH